MRNLAAKLKAAYESPLDGPEDRSPLQESIEGAFDNGCPLTLHLQSIRTERAGKAGDLLLAMFPVVFALPSNGIAARLASGSHVTEFFAGAGSVEFVPALLERHDNPHLSTELIDKIEMPAAKRIICL